MGVGQVHRISIVDVRPNLVDVCLWTNLSEEGKVIEVLVVNFTDSVMVPSCPFWEYEPLVEVTGSYSLAGAEGGEGMTMDMRKQPSGIEIVAVQEHGENPVTTGLVVMAPPECYLEDTLD